MTVAVMDRKPQPATADALPGLRLMVLARIACDEGASRPELARELGTYAGTGPAARLPVEAELAQLIRAGLAIESRSRFSASPEGVQRLLAALALKALPKTWGEMRDIRLVAKALGLERDNAARLKGLAKADVLRGEIIVASHGLKLKGAASSTRLRAALALVALERAFGDGIKGELSASAGLNAKASRVLAGQLLRKPRDAGTDKRLIAMLAAECAGCAKMDAEQLRAALLKRLAQGENAAAAPDAPVSKVSESKVPVSKLAPTLEGPAPAGVPGVSSTVKPPAANRPDLAGFVKIVRHVASQHAEGWPGNRKALVSRVFNALTAAHPGWGLKLVEFKAMLAECHRLGHVALVTADLKDKRLLEELRLSAIAYKNTVWHLIRIED